MPRYVARPVVIDAVEWRGDITDLPEQWRATDSFQVDGYGDLIIQTLEGPARAIAALHFVVHGTKGEFYPVRRDIFLEKYTPATDGEGSQP